MSKEIEEWRDIEGFEGLYQVSDWGRVRNAQTQKIKKLTPNSKWGYLYVMLYKNNIPTCKRVNRLVAKAFIPNLENKKQVGHWDCNKENNTVENLYWCTQEENLSNEITRSQRINNPKRSMCVYQYTLDNVFEKQFPSLHEAEREGFGRKEIKKCCLGLLTQHKGHKWSFNPL